MENERLKRELKSCRSSELQKLHPAAESCSCSCCPHRQVSLHRCKPRQVRVSVSRNLLHLSVLQDVELLRREVSRWQVQARQKEQRLAEVEQLLQESSCREEALQLQLEKSRRRQGEAENHLRLRLQEYEEELNCQAATSPRVKVRVQAGGGGA